MQTNERPTLPKTRLRILIAERSPVISDGLAGMLFESDGIFVVGRAGKPLQALAMIESIKPDVVLLDIQMPGDSLISWLHLIKRAVPVPAVIVLADYPSEVLRSRCLHAGADYVFTKTIDLDSVADTLRKLLADKEAAKGFGARRQL